MRKAAQYRELQNGVASAAARGYVDTVISPADTRKYVIGCILRCCSQREKIVRLRNMERSKRGDAYENDQKITSVFMTFLVMAALVIGSTSVVFAADKVDDTVKSTLVTTAEGLTDAIVQLKDEEIENYMSSGDDFTTSAMQSWQTSKDELGAKKDSNGETTVTFKDDQYTVTVPLKFEKADANFVYVFDSQGTPTSMSVDVQYGMGKTLQRAGLNTLMGIGTVFVMLILLSLLISLFRFIPNPEAKKAAEAKQPKAAKEAEAAAIAQTAPAQAEENLADDGELVAVIAAAIAAAEGTTTDGFVVRSIRKVKRNRKIIVIYLGGF